MVPGHPFKGVNGMSIGQLAHPDVKRFQMNTQFLFAPPHPEKVMGASAAAVSVPAFGVFFQSYFGGRISMDQSSSDDRCGKMLLNMKRCYEGAAARQEDFQSSCSYYIDGFRRLACSN